MVGAARLELATPRSQSECATNCATPRSNNSSNVKLFFVIGKHFFTHTFYIDGNDDHFCQKEEKDLCIRE